MKQDVLEGLRSAARSGASREDVIADMRRNDLPIMDAIKAMRELYSISLGEAKQLVTQHPGYSATAAAAAPIHDELMQSFAEAARKQHERP